MKTPMPGILIVIAFLLAVAALPATAAAGPLPNGGYGPGGVNLSTWKLVLTTVLLVVALAQAGGQAVVLGRIKADRRTRLRLARLHRPGGIIAFTLTLAALAMCLYVMYGPNGGGLNALYNTRVVLHAVFGGLLMLVLTAKAIISNFVRKQLRLNAPLGIAAGVLTLGVFVLSVVPHVLGLE